MNDSKLNGNFPFALDFSPQNVCLHCSLTQQHTEIYPPKTLKIETLVRTTTLPWVRIKFVNRWPKQDEGVEFHLGVLSGFLGIRVSKGASTQGLYITNIWAWGKSDRTINHTSKAQRLIRGWVQQSENGESDPVEEKKAEMLFQHVSSTKDGRQGKQFPGPLTMMFSLHLQVLVASLFSSAHCYMSVARATTCSVFS